MNHTGYAENTPPLSYRAEELLPSSASTGTKEAPKLCKAPECQINKRCGWPDDCLRFNPGEPGY